MARQQGVRLSDAEWESLAYPFIGEAIAEGLSKTATMQLLRDQGVAVSRARLDESFSRAYDAWAEYQRTQPSAELRPAIAGHTAPTQMRIATDWLYTVKMRGADGRERSLNYATNDATLTEQDIIDRALGVANDRTRYAPGTAIPAGGWTEGWIESAWQRAA